MKKIASEDNPKEKKTAKIRLLPIIKAVMSINKEVDKEKYFILSNGSRITTLKQFSLELDTMPDDIFHYHVNSLKNDFYIWVKDALNEPALAEEIIDIKNKKDMQLCVLKHIITKITKE